MDTPVLIDSHILIWLLFEPQHLSERCRRAVEEAQELYVSLASLWELTLKFNKGLLKYQPGTIAEGYKKMNITLLPVTEAHILATSTIDLPHKDPFDNLLVAQAKVGGMTLLTYDKQIIDSRYPTIDARI